MKAILKSNRKVIIDVAPWFVLRGEQCYRDAKTGKIYLNSELEFVEYQGG